MSVAAQVLLGALATLTLFYVWRWIALERGGARPSAPASRGLVLLYAAIAMLRAARSRGVHEM